MSLCPSCGAQLPEDDHLCRHHPASHGDDWAEGNRVLCDFFHRGKVLPRLALPDREDTFWAFTEDVG